MIPKWSFSSDKYFTYLQDIVNTLASISSVNSIILFSSLVLVTNYSDLLTTTSINL